MLIIENGTNISYTKGDTFSLTVGAVNGFSENSTLRFIVAEDEESEPVIENTYNLNGEGVFSVVLEESDRDKLVIDDYKYKLTLIDSAGITITQKSGDFRVKWGA